MANVDPFMRHLIKYCPFHGQCRRLLSRLKALEQAERDREDERKRRELEDENRRRKDEEERMKRAEDEERRRGEAEGKELLFSWRTERDDLERWLKKEEPKLQQEPDDLDLIGLREELKQIKVSGPTTGTAA